MSYNLQSGSSWVNHFSKMAKGGVKYNRKYYVVGGQVGQGVNNEPPVTVVSPTKTAVDMAQSEIKRISRTKTIKRAGGKRIGRRTAKRKVGRKGGRKGGRKARKPRKSRK